MIPVLNRFVLALTAVACCFACTRDKGIRSAGSGYPDDIAAILLARCAVPGCHTDASRHVAARLSMSSWEKLFEGSSNGAVAIPYSAEFSTMLFFTNTFADLGPALEPRMPLNGAALSRGEVVKLRDWIIAGAPDKNGRVMFRDDPNRKKMLVCNRLCDMVIVMDAATMLQMACVNVGLSPRSEFPACIKVSPDRKHWYCSFLASTILRKFNADSDAPDGQLDLGEGVWTAFEISPDGRTAFCADKSAEGSIAVVDLQQMTLKRRIAEHKLFYPSDLALINDSVAYAASEMGNFVTRINITNTGTSVTPVILDGSKVQSTVSSIDPNVVFAADEKLWIGCRNTGQLMCLDTKNDSITSVVALGAASTFMAFDAARQRMFVTCMDDSVSFAGHTGSVKIVDARTAAVIRTINAGYQSAGIVVVPEYNYAMIVNANISPRGPAPHHTTGCSGRNGYASFIDLETLEMIPDRKVELASFPFSCAAR